MVTFEQVMHFPRAGWPVSRISPQGGAAIPCCKQQDIFFFFKKNGCILGTQGMEAFNVDLTSPLLQAVGLFQLMALVLWTVRISGTENER